MAQGSLFGPDQAATSKQAGDQWTELRVLITVKAAPNPSETYGETVCVAGIRLDLDQPGWVRLYPINFRDLESTNRFRKYDIVELRAKPARQDLRVESWRPDVTSIRRVDHLRSWKSRRLHIEPYIGSSMCAVLRAVREAPPARSLAAVRPEAVVGINIEPHPGWTREQQEKLDAYVGQFDLEGTDRAPLEAPRFMGWYRYKCHEVSCKIHRQSILDWEFVAFQRRFGHYDDAALVEALRGKFYNELCAPGNDVAFYVGNQAKRQHTFSVLGVYYPKR